MIEHPEFDRSASGSIGLWTDNGRIIGAAIYDMYFGEAFCAVLPGYESLYPSVLDYAYRTMKDDSGLATAICDESLDEIGTAERSGFERTAQNETVMCIELGDDLPVQLPEGLRFAELDPAKEPYDFQWLLWQGFDHGTDRDEFEREDKIVPQIRGHLNPYLSVTAVDGGEKVGYCCLWYSEQTDYAYAEPVCVIPRYRGRGVAGAVIREALNRARRLGAKRAYVISDMDFYAKLGFKICKRFTFYRKR